MQPLKVIILNCTLKKSPAISNTDALIAKAVKLYEAEQHEVNVIRVADYKVAFGVSSDEGSGDEWPQILAEIKAANILIIATPIWFGVRGSIAQMVMERLDGTYSEGDANTGQYPLYNKVGGVIVTGNEDGAHDVVANTAANLMHLGCTIPPNADSYWVGEAGPGKSYIEAGGERHLYTNRTVRYMVANTTAIAKMLQVSPLATNLKQLDEAAKAESD